MTTPAGGGATRAGSAVRVAVVGLGWAGRSIWLPRFRAHAAYRVVAVVDPVPSARDDSAPPGSGVRPLADVAELDAANVDLAVVAVPNHLHSSVACRLLRRGIPVFVEKPVCITSAEAAELAAAERDGGAVLLAGSAARNRADVRALADVVATLGTVRHVDLTWVRARGVPDTGGWFTRQRLSGGGALVDLGWHLLDTLGPLLGPWAGDGFDQVVGTVSGDFIAGGTHAAAWRHRPPSDPGTTGDNAASTTDVEDTARGFLVTSGGVSVALRASWASHEALDTTLVRVEGSAGAATLECTFGFSPNRHSAPRLTVTRNGATMRVGVPAEPIGVEYDRQTDEIRHRLADPTARGTAVDEARRTIAVIERLYASATGKRRQPVLT